MSDGGCAGRGLMGGGRGRVGDVESPTLAVGGTAVETFNLSLGRVGGTGGGSRAAEGLASRSRSRPGFGAGAGAGAGAGDAVRDDAAVWGWVSVLFRFSNLASSEDTGLWRNKSQSQPQGSRTRVLSRVRANAARAAHEGRAVGAIFWRRIHGSGVGSRAAASASRDCAAQSPVA